MNNYTTDNSEKDWDEVLKNIENAKKIGSPWEAYDFTLTNDNTKNKVASSFYIEHFLMAAILEAFLINERLDFRDLNKAIYEYVPKDFIWDTPAKISQIVILKMVRLGYIEATKNGNNILPIFNITKLGIETLQQQTFQSLSATSFFNYQTHLFSEQSQLINKRSFKINVLAMSVAILSVILTIITTLRTC
jgi:hypothetical protein